MPRYFWLADACQSAGLRTVEVQGWRTRGEFNFRPRGVVIHHTAGGARGDMPSLSVLVGGRRDLPGPLAQFGVSRSGTVYVIAAGVANHAGPGGWRGLSGNGSVWGIEAENTGTGAEAWPAVQLDAMRRLAAVLANKTPFGAGMVCGHKEWSPTRKVDPRGIDMDDYRRKVADLTAPPASPITITEDDDMIIAGDGTSAWLITGGVRIWIQSPGELAALRAKLPYFEAPTLVAATPIARAS